MGDFLTTVNLERLTRQKGVDYPYKKIKPLIDNYSIAFANMESAVSDRGTPVKNKTWVFKTSTYCAGYFPYSGIDVVSLANNHILDYGKDALSNTIKFMKTSGIAYCGAGMNEFEARKPAILKYEGIDILFLAYNELPPADYFAKSSKCGSAKIDDDKIISDITNYKRSDNFLFVSLHWGTEHSYKIEAKQIERAHKYIDAGADGIIGHHPHVPQGVEIYKGKPIFYSLGNALNGFYNEKYKANIFGAVNIYGGRIVSIGVIPVEGDNYIMEFQPYQLKGDSAVRVVEMIEKLSSEFGTDFTISEDHGIIKLL